MEKFNSLLRCRLNKSVINYYPKSGALRALGFAEIFFICNEDYLSNKI
jgi:hypothetical protein